MLAHVVLNASIRDFYTIFIWSWLQVTTVTSQPLSQIILPPGEPLLDSPPEICPPPSETSIQSSEPPPLETSIQLPSETSPLPSESSIQPPSETSPPPSAINSLSLQEQWMTTVVPHGWVNQTETQDAVVRYCKLQNMPVGFGNQPVRVHICLLVILPGGSWEVYSQDKWIDPSITLHDWPATLTSDALYEYLSLLDNLTTCNGNADQELMEIAVKRKGIFKAAKGKEVKARVDSIPFVSDGKPYSATIRTSECQILVKEGRCKACKVYRRTLLSGILYSGH